MSFARLAQPGSIGSLPLANRVMMPAMATNLASAIGEATDRLIAYYAERARGGAGLIIAENATIEHHLGGNGAVQLRIDSDRYIPGLHRLASAIRSGGAASAIQINHAGAVARTEELGVAPVAPSAVSWTGARAEPQALSLAEIDELIARFARAAVRAQRAGFDAVEIHGGHGYLIAQFLSPRMNRRSDRYGGSPEGRWRFAREVVRAVREAVGPEYPLLFRVSGDEYLPGGRTIDETAAFAGALAGAGADAIHVTAATPANPERQLEPMSYPEAWRIGLAEAVKRVVGVPVVGVGVIRTPETAERVLAEGKADFVAIGRGLIADPEWLTKATRGQPRSIRRCISCNRCVRNRVFDDLPIRCSVNPRVGRETEEPPRSERPRCIAVVGGGPGGLSAAIAAATRGDRVVLFEVDTELGGRLRLAKVPPHKEKIGWLIEDLTAALPESVDVRLGSRATAAALRALSPDLAVLACGATPKRPDVAGVDLHHVHSADELLAGRVQADGRVVVIGGGMVGCETALFCAENGCDVALVEPLCEVAGDCEPITRKDLVGRLVERAVRVRTGASVREIEATHVLIDGEAGEEQLDADAVVYAIGGEPDRSLMARLGDAPFPVRAVGDARAVRGLCEAVYEGWRAVLEPAGAQEGRWNES